MACNQVLTHSNVFQLEKQLWVHMCWKTRFPTVLGMEVTFFSSFFAVVMLTDLTDLSDDLGTAPTWTAYHMYLAKILYYLLDILISFV